MRILRKLLDWINEFRSAAKTQEWTRPMYTTYIVYLTSSVIFGAGFVFMSTALLFAGVGGLAAWALCYGIILLAVSLALLRVPIWAEKKEKKDASDDQSVETG